MEKIALHAYLMFDGNCREAIHFYQGVFGGEVTLMTFGEVDGSCPAAMRDRVMHAMLRGGEIELMASDSMDDMPLGVGKINIALSGADEANLTKKFEQLSEGGQIIVPLGKQVWGDIFGCFADQYNVNWMVNINLAPRDM